MVDLGEDTETCAMLGTNGLAQSTLKHKMGMLGLDLVWDSNIEVWAIVMYRDSD